MIEKRRVFWALCAKFSVSQAAVWVLASLIQSIVPPILSVFSVLWDLDTVNSVYGFLDVLGGCLIWPSPVLALEGAL